MNLDGDVPCEFLRLDRGKRGREIFFTEMFPLSYKRHK